MPRYVEELVSSQVHKSEIARRRREEAGHPCHAPVITISRGMGSGARIIAEKLADRLGWSLWAKELIDAIAEDAAVSRKVVEAFDEHTISELELFARAALGASDWGDFLYPKHLAKAIGAIAKLGNAIILGRGANIILPEALSIRIDASDEFRIQNMMKFEGMTHEAAAAKIHHSDREREHFLMSTFGKERVRTSRFDLQIWMDEFTNDDAVEIILTALKSKCPLIMANGHSKRG